MNGSTALVLPVMAQVLLTFVMLLWMGRARVAAIKAGRVRLADVALRGGNWPDGVRKVANNAHNQFETPILFYVLAVVAMLVGARGVLITLFAWGYIISRLAHTAIQVTSNRVRHRFAAFVVGVAMLFCMWLVIAVRLLAGG